MNKKKEIKKFKIIYIFANICCHSGVCMYHFCMECKKNERNYVIKFTHRITNNNKENENSSEIHLMNSKLSMFFKKKVRCINKTTTIFQCLFYILTI